jgi:biopolymer transport protein ExbB
LYLSGINTQKFVARIEDLLKTKGVEAAKEECRLTRGPVASIYFQGLDRVDEGIEKVEASVQSYGSVQMGILEKGMVWISLFIALSPMLGFLGTVVGMIQAFDKIAEVGDISPTIVASGIKVALLTTVAGLIVAIILQVFYNLILSKIDSIANDMEEASISLTDMLIKNKIVK